MKIALVDDNSAALKQLSDMISKELSSIRDTIHHTALFNNGEALLEGWHPGDYDLIVLDIFMNCMTGVDVARKIRESDEDVRLVFCSSSNEFAAESYEVNANYYLCKPISEQSISNMFKRLNLEIINLTRTIRLPDGYTVMLRKILYTDYFNHVVTLHIKDEADHLLRLSQAEIERLLFSYGYFCCCSKGIIVNFYEIVNQKGDSFVLSNGALVPISRRKSKEVGEAYTRFRFNKMRKEIDC